MHVNREELGRSPLHFFKKSKSALILEKKRPDCGHLWIKFSIEIVVLIVYRRKTSKMFPYALRGFFSYVFDKTFIELP